MYVAFGSWRALGFVLLGLVRTTVDAAEPCEDSHPQCKSWAKLGECGQNPGFMLNSCKKSCRVCASPETERRGPCQDRKTNCWQLTRNGECILNSSRMVKHCPETCFACGAGDPCIADATDPGAFHGASGAALDAMFRNIITNESLQQFGPRALSKEPWVVVFDNFLSDEEVALVQDSVDGQWMRSAAGGAQGAGAVNDNVRTSEQIWCSGACSQSPGASIVHDRVEQITGVSRTRYEHIQMLRYLPGQQYKEHVDFIAAHSRMACGPRLMTFFVYLSDSAGGDTKFPKLGLNVPARKGTAALWHNVRVDNLWMQDDRTQHQGLPPTGSTKYAANVWIHQYDFNRFDVHQCFNPDRELQYRPGARKQKTEL